MMTRQRDRSSHLQSAGVAFGLVCLFLLVQPSNAASVDDAASHDLTNEAVAVWQHRDTSGSSTDWDIWYSFLGRRKPTDPSSALTWHADGGPVKEAAPIATLSGDDKNPHVATNAGVTLAVWQHASGTGNAPGDWDIFFARFDTATGTWTAPSPVATFTGDDYDPNVAVDSNGNAVVVWVHRNADGTRQVFTAVRSGGVWSTPAAVPTGGARGKASLPEVSITSVAAAGGALAHRVVAAWSDGPATGAPKHRILSAIFDGLKWTTPAEIESATTGVAVSIDNVGYAEYVGTDPDPFAAFGRLGVTSDASGNAYVVWSGGPEILYCSGGKSDNCSPGIVGAILNVAANTWTPKVDSYGSRLFGLGDSDNPDNALIPGGGDFVGVFNFIGMSTGNIFETAGGAFTSDTFSYFASSTADRPSDAAISATELISVNWEGSVGATSEITWALGTVIPGVGLSFTTGNNLVAGTLTGEDMFPELASGFVEPPIVFTLSPATATTPAGTALTVTANVAIGATPAPGITITLAVTGDNTASGTCVTGSNGQCTFTYTGTNTGADTITATATVAEEAQPPATAAVTVTEAKDTKPPTVSITAPAAGAKVGSTITVSASATDNRGVVGVQFKLDGVNLGAMVTSAPYVLSWNTAKASQGVHKLTADASDAAGNTATSAAVSVTVDNTRPSISSVSASNVASSGARITWTTNEASDSQVEYGLTDDYGNVTPLGSGLVTVHSQTLSGLKKNKWYYYRVISRDAAGNLAVSDDFRFKTKNK